VFAEGRDHRPAGIQQGIFEAQDSVWGRDAPCEVFRQLVGVPMGVHHHIGHAGDGQAIECMIKQCAAAEGEQRLWRGFGERPHAAAEAGGEQDGAWDGGHGDKRRTSFLKKEAKNF